MMFGGLPQQYILVDRKVVRANMLEAAEFAKDPANCIVAQEECEGHQVSTVFLKWDHSRAAQIEPWLPHPKPILFETMIFGPETNFKQQYSTWEEAEVGHRQALDMLRGKNILEFKKP